MASSRSQSALLSALLLLLAAVASAAAAVEPGNFYKDCELTWGDDRGKVGDGGRTLNLTLDKVSGSGFASKNEFLFGKVDMAMKLVPGNSAGTVTTFYLSSQGPTHDEIDMEFLGNVTGQPYTLHTNVFTNGKGGREQQFRLWFDPTAAYHVYSILWNPNHIIFAVDGTPIRDFKNMEARGVAFPKSQPMKVYASLWNADDWATMGGRVKTDWSNAPFTASFRDFRADACVAGSAARCPSAPEVPERREAAAGGWWAQELNDASYRRMRWVQRKFMIYDYCTDEKRFATPGTPPPECRARTRAGH